MKKIDVLNNLREKYLAKKRAEEEYDEARAKFESKFPPGTVMAEDDPFYWNPENRLVGNPNDLPAKFTKVSIDTAKVRAEQEITGVLPVGVREEVAYKLRYRG